MWQTLVRNWIAQTARQRMQAAAQDAARRAAGGGASDPRNTAGPQAAAGHEDAAQPTVERAPEVCHVGAVFALGIEAGGLADRLAGVISIDGAGFRAREGGLAGRRVVVIESGAGAAAARHSTAALLAGHQPRWVISAGFAGGLAPQLRRGDILMPDRLTDLSGAELEVDFRIPPAELSAHPRLHIGRLLTVDRVIATPAEKRALGAQHAALAVDMESFAVAQECRRSQVRFLAVRVISDDVDRQLPPEIDHLLSRQTNAGRLGAAARAVFRRPSSVKDMWQLKEDALLASERLGQFLAGVIEQLS